MTAEMAIIIKCGLLFCSSCKMLQNLLILFHRSELSSLDPALKNRCQRLAQSIACHSVYSYCDPSHDVPTPRLICKTSCDTFSAGGICERFISEAETPELYSRLADKCDTREHPAGSSPECVPIDMETAQIGKCVTT